MMSSPAAPSIVSTPSPPVILSTPASPVIVSASVLSRKDHFDPPEAVLIVSMFFNLSLSAGMRPSITEEHPHPLLVHHIRVTYQPQQSLGYQHQQHHQSAHPSPPAILSTPVSPVIVSAQLSSDHLILQRPS